MRRMYSEQELTNVIKAVFEQELEDGALDENVADAVDAYLVENPVDITALEGQDISCNSVDADATITGGEIVEKMSGYSFASGTISTLTNEVVFAGVVKNGNKITFVLFAKITRTGESQANRNVGVFTIPADIYSKLYPVNFGQYACLNVLDINAYSSFSQSVKLGGYIEKGSNNKLNFALNGYADLTLNTTYTIRIEQTFLLSDNLVPQE